MRKFSGNFRLITDAYIKRNIIAKIDFERHKLKLKKKKRVSRIKLRYHHANLLTSEKFAIGFQLDIHFLSKLLLNKMISVISTFQCQVHFV